MSFSGCAPLPVPQTPATTYNLGVHTPRPRERTPQLLPGGDGGAFASASATYLPGHKRFDFLHVGTVSEAPCRKELTNHPEPPAGWPRHREAIVSGHVRRPSFPFPGHAGKCSLPPAARCGRREQPAPRGPGRRTAGASVNPAALPLGDPGSSRVCLRSSAWTRRQSNRRPDVERQEQTLSDLYKADRHDAPRSVPGRGTRGKALSGRWPEIVGLRRWRWAWKGKVWPPWSAGGWPG